ncbi:MBL fold metallo-hydrolase [Gimesia panareensis]|uniref:MBL fold metallo-hydrolase n=1 Tax=Gimesia panareensis TaxID=2527978 RepID=UPI00118A8297|nr:MBL fold metallo-hydrolase [Gimesia panareensis]QDU50653.1 putative polyketide biosynthesis zinc-dependent hydrolase BaeB [Gimesia panareensis]
MLLKYFYDQKLAHASYLVGCQKTKEAIVVDPGRDVEQYLEMAQREGVNLIGVAETHIHADYVSGARELADRIGAKLYVSDEGPSEWKYEYAAQYDAQLLKEGDTFQVGKIRFDVLHTPGHTPESISFLLTDQGGGADEPMGIFTGDFVFVGSIGRPDLLEEAAGIQGSAAVGAQQLYHSAQRFKELPDYLQVWPAHGAGSACGKGLGAIPSSTVGYEKRFNPALQFEDETEFVNYILADQPEAPRYFAVMKRVNKEGPLVLGKVSLPKPLPEVQESLVSSAATVIDLSPSTEFAQAHVPGTINIPLSVLAAWAGWLVDYEQPVYLITDEADLPEAYRVLHKIGVDRIAGWFERSAVTRSGDATQSYHAKTPNELAPQIESGAVTLFDVRSDAEWNEGHIPQAEHRFLGHFPDMLSTLESHQPIVVQCRSGARSAIAASLLQAAGIDVINLAGGYQVWETMGLPTTVSTDPVGCATNPSGSCS